MKVCETLAEALIAEGIDTVFGVMGDGNMALWAAAADRGIRLLSARHEAAAAGMAEGHARVRDAIGVATVTCGPGLTHAATPIIAAARHRTPLVIIAGDTAVNDLASPQRLDQQRFASACEAGFVGIIEAAEAVERIEHAFCLARTKRMPVVLDIPMDIFEHEVPQGQAIRSSSSLVAGAPLPSGDNDVAMILDALRQSRRPVVLAGRGAVRAGAKQALIALADKTGALLGTSLLAMNLFHDHPHAIGVIGGFSSGSAERLLRRADLVLAFGTTLAGHADARAKPLLDQARIIRIDNDRQAEPALTTSETVLADARVMAEELAAGLPEPSPRPDWTREARAALSAGLAPHIAPSDGLDPRRLMKELSAALPEDVRITCGVGHFWGFPVMRLVLPAAASIEFTYAFGAIGAGLPMAIGIAAASRERPHMLIEGDGSLLQHLQELETVVREGLDLVVLVMNDAGYGAEVHKLAAKGLDPALAQWRSPDFVAVARALGGEGVLLRREAEIADALREGLARGGLYLIDARLSPTARNDRYLKALG